MKAIVFAACLEQPQMQESDAVLAAALEARGAKVRTAAWNGDQSDFAAADAIVVRSTWDYQKTPDAFARWIDAIADGGAQVINPPALMRWNMSKRYLLGLAEKGAPLPPTRLVEPDGAVIAAAMDAMGVAVAVAKPEYGGTASGLSLVRREDAAGLAAAAVKMAMPGIVQALIPEIRSHGETSLIFIDGEFTHAVTKRPKPGEILCQAEFGGVAEAARAPGWAVAEARGILALLPERPLYARIDAVILDGTMRLMEVEVIEPELFFTYSPDSPDAPGAAQRFADALINRL